MPARLSDPRLWSLSLAALLAGLALLLPKVNMKQRVVDVVAIVDITGSMNTRDMRGGTASRLQAVKRALSQLLVELPCQSRLGLGVFTERRSFLLFDPVEVCENFAPLEGAIDNLDWRMGWEGDSLISKGLYSAVAIAESLHADVLFATDGQEAPPPPPGIGASDFEGKRGEVKGMILGVGGKEKVPIPKFDDEGHEVGVYGPTDVTQENHAGPPPEGAEKLPGFHPKWAPFGTATSSGGEEHLTSLRGDYLEKLARKTGLSYASLAETKNLGSALIDASHVRSVVVAADMRPLLGAAALALLMITYLAPLAAQAIGRFRSIATDT